jgi:bacterial/archaeal transporter family-2 protein
MPKAGVIAILIAILSGLAIGVQSSLNSAAGKMTGAVITGLLVNFAGGMASALLLLIIFIRQRNLEFLDFKPTVFGVILLSGLLGIGIITGVAYALPKIGVAAGLSAIIAGQMVVALIVDTFGLTGAKPIPITLSRLMGLMLLALGTWALLPKK